MKASKFGEKIPAQEDCRPPEAALKPSLPETSKAGCDPAFSFYFQCQILIQISTFFLTAVWWRVTGDISAQ